MLSNPKGIFTSIQRSSYVRNRIFLHLRADAVEVREDRVLLLALHEAGEQVAVEARVHLEQRQVRELLPNIEMLDDQLIAEMDMSETLEESA